MSTIRNSSRLIVTPMLIVMLMIGGAGCKSKKKAMEAAKEKERMEQQAALEKQRAEEEARRKREEEERARRESESKAVEPRQKLDLFFNAIANASSPAQANNSINEALTLFSSPDAPVLIVISEEGGQKDYDRPTTIRNYLNYLKDQKKRADQISNVQFDSTGKITELELKKQL